eukprot:scaffold103996_cov66-Phaeocystis_antarctica.AAC.1
MVKVPPSWQRPSSPPAPPQGAPGGPGRYALPLGAQPRPRVLERAASKAADSTAPARPLHLLRARLVALGGMHSQGASRPTGRPATALGARASRLQSRPSPRR